MIHSRDTNVNSVGVLLIVMLAAVILGLAIFGGGCGGAEPLGSAPDYIDAGIAVTDIPGRLPHDVRLCGGVRVVAGGGLPVATCDFTDGGEIAYAVASTVFTVDGESPVWCVESCNEPGARSGIGPRWAR